MPQSFARYLSVVLWSFAGSLLLCAGSLALRWSSAGWAVRSLGFFSGLDVGSFVGCW